MYSLYKFVDQGVIFFAPDSLMPHPEVERVLLQLDIIGADIDGHRQTPGRMNPGTGGIKRQLTDRYAHPGNTQIAQPENAFTVGDHNDTNLFVGPILQDFRKPAFVFIGNKNAFRAAINMDKLLTSQADGRGVYDGHHLFEMIGQHPIKQGLVAILESHQKNVFLQVGRFAVVISHDPQHLLFHGIDSRRQEPPEP